MNILLLTPQLPYPPHQGTSLRNWHILQGVAQHHHVTLLSFAEQTPTDDALARLLAACAGGVVTVPVPQRSLCTRLVQLMTTDRADMALRLANETFDAKLAALLAERAFDIVQIEGIELAQRMALVRTVAPACRIVFDNHNAETALQRTAFETDRLRPARWIAAAYSWVQVRRLRRYERWACESADSITVVSDHDRDALAALSPASAAKLTVIPNCLDVKSLRKVARNAPDEAQELVFVGKMDYRPNVDAMLWFADAIWPLVRADCPQATLSVVGQKPHERLAALHGVAGITLTGWVDSVTAYIQAAAVVVMPLRMGSGTRLKMIEAMALGKAIVSTRIGAEGYPVHHDRELLLADDAAAFAAHVVRLLQRPAERQRLGAAAAAFAERYDWRVITPRFDAVYQTIMTGRSGGADSVSAA